MLAAVLVSFATGAAAEDALLTRGKGSYEMLCSKCHGINMVNSGASAFDLRKFPVNEKARFYESVTHGKGDMPAWGDILLDGELDALWRYVSTGGGVRPPPDESSSAEPPPELVEPDQLTACLARNGGALSGKRADGGSGFDYRVVEAIAGEMGLKLDVTWFESEPEEESDPVRETYAMLALGLCDVAAAQPLYENAVGPPPAPTAAPPRWDEMPEHWGHRQVKLEPVAASAPYMRAEIGIVVGPSVSAEGIHGLADLRGLSVGVQQGTLSGALVMMQAPADVIGGVRTFNPGPAFLWEVEKGEVQAAVADVTEFDTHLKQNPISELRLAGWRHPLGFNMGLAMLERNVALRAHVNAAIAALSESGALARLARAEGVHYAPPRAPDMQRALTRHDLIAIR